jgi:hypothetical protein
MVLGIISLAVLPLGCCCGIGFVVSLPLGIAGVVLGFMARSKIAAGNNTLGGSGKALAGIVTGGTAVLIAAVIGVAYLFFGLAGPAILNALPSPAPTG